mmetsp:Transcript_26823/g.67707  ORF Transcript_26823/g.67707 Transcript_26823/m.67707 type:complete len:393 (-) Transcript_26823:408-1586(-)
MGRRAAPGWQRGAPGHDRPLASTPKPQVPSLSTRSKRSPPAPHQSRRLSSPGGVGGALKLVTGHRSPRGGRSVAAQPPKPARATAPLRSPSGRRHRHPDVTRAPPPSHADSTRFCMSHGLPVGDAEARSADPGAMMGVLGTLSATSDRSDRAAKHARSSTQWSHEHSAPGTSPAVHPARRDLLWSCCASSMSISKMSWSDPDELLLAASGCLFFPLRGSPSRLATGASLGAAVKALAKAVTSLGECEREAAPSPPPNPPSLPSSLASGSDRSPCSDCSRLRSVTVCWRTVFLSNLEACEWVRRSRSSSKYPLARCLRRCSTTLWLIFCASSISNIMSSSSWSPRSPARSQARDPGAMGMPWRSLMWSMATARTLLRSERASTAGSIARSSSK